MKHLLTLGILSLTLTACSADGEPQVDPESGPAPIELRRDVDPGPSPWDLPTGQISKSIHYADFNTVKGTTYLNGAIIVDHILAHDGDDVFSVNVRIRNTTSESIRGDYLIEFRTRNLELIAGHKRSWEPFVIDGHGVAVLSNSALIRGAVGFKLFITNKAAEIKPQQGQPDPAKPGEPEPAKPPEQPGAPDAPKPAEEKKE